MTLSPEQTTVADIVMAALNEDADELARLINDLHRKQIRDATSLALALVVATLRNYFTPEDWQALINEARASRLLLDLETETP